MNAARFYQFMIDSIIPETMSATGRWGKRWIFQFDGAGRRTGVLYLLN